MNGKKAKKIRKQHDVKHVRFAPREPAQGTSVAPKIKFRFTDEGERRSDVPETLVSQMRPKPEKPSHRIYKTIYGEQKFNPSNRGFTRPLSGGPSRTRGGR